jgi:hypothetical protein
MTHGSTSTRRKRGMGRGAHTTTGRPHRARKECRAEVHTHPRGPPRTSAAGNKRHTHSTGRTLDCRKKVNGAEAPHTHPAPLPTGRKQLEAHTHPRPTSTRRMKQRHTHTHGVDSRSKKGMGQRPWTFAHRVDSTRREEWGRGTHTHGVDLTSKKGMGQRRNTPTGPTLDSSKKGIAEATPTQWVDLDS